MQKDKLRLHFKTLRSEMSADAVDLESIAIANHVLKLPVWNLSFFHLFLSIKQQKEVETSPILSILQGKDKNVVVPKVLPHGRLQNYLLTDNTQLVLNALNIPEPVDGIAIAEMKLDVVFVPLLAFDRKGNRVGYGKGFYDRFLSRCRTDVVKIGLSFFEAVAEIADAAPHDIRLDYCVTPKEIYEF